MESSGVGSTGYVVHVDVHVDVHGEYVVFVGCCNYYL